MRKSTGRKEEKDQIKRKEKKKKTKETKERKNEKNPLKEKSDKKKRKKEANERRTQGRKSAERKAQTKCTNADPAAMQGPLKTSPCLHPLNLTGAIVYGADRNWRETYTRGNPQPNENSHGKNP